MKLEHKNQCILIFLSSLDIIKRGKLIMNTVSTCYEPPVSLFFFKGEGGGNAN